ncbi:MAG TPA: CHAD domain-containing protein, partial [Anaerolineae bacterium]|nr:CHAD domain-containing protein [Anaerolineae bacterium]
IDQALEQLTEAPEGRDETVHDARKRLKKIRAVLRLVRDEIGDEVYQRENTCYRDAGRQLAGIRDSFVLIKTLDDVAERYADDLDNSKAYKELRKKLAAEHEAIKRQRLEHDQKMAEVAATLKEARQRVETWPIAHNDFSGVSGGLKRVYKRGYRALTQAYDNPTPENFHEWRKRVKYLWYHIRILENVWADPMVELGNQLDDLADYLGDYHDLAGLSHMLINRPELIDDKDREDLVKLLNKRQAKLLIQARQLGERIYVEQPKVFVQRIGSYWEVWQADTVLK